VYKLRKALYGLKQALRAWYARLRGFLFERGFEMGKVIETLFLLRQGRDILIVQVYVDDIVFGCSSNSPFTWFADDMSREFEMSMMGELQFFLGLQVKQLLGVSENLDEIPEHERKESGHVKYTDDAKGDKESPKDCSNLKSCVPLTHALAPPFIGRRRDFYIPKTPSDSRNIPSVNTYMNVFYISYIYKPATSSHTKPGLFETTSLTWLPTDS
jgi:hypothetical protein